MKDFRKPWKHRDVGITAPGFSFGYALVAPVQRFRKSGLGQIRLCAKRRDPLADSFFVHFHGSFFGLMF